MGMWLMEEPLLDEKGMVVRGGMWHHQKEWWELPNFIKALVTGYGSGKTLIAGKRSIACALENAPVPHVWVSPSYKIARRTAIPTLKSLLDGKIAATKGQLSYRYNKSDSEFTVSYKGREGVIWVTSGDDPDSLKGPNIGTAIIDEPFIQDRAVFDQILARVRDPSAKILEIGLTGTPEDLNWGYDICEGESKKNFDIGVVHASTRANRAIGGQYANRLEKGLSEKAAQAYVEGRFVSLTEGLVYYGFDSDRNVVDLPDPGSELIVGMDFNVNPMAAVVFWRNANHLHAIEEIELPNSDTEAMCGYLREKYGRRLHTIIPDASGRARHTNSPGGRSDFHIIREAGFDIDCGPINPPKRDRYNAVNGKFRPKMGNPTLTLSKACPKLIRYLKSYSHKDLNEEYQKAMSHLLDAFGYPVVRLFPIRIERPDQIRVVGT